jgi:hypothetical protein
MWTNTFLFLPFMAIGWRLGTSGVENGGGWGLRATRAFLVSLGVTVGHSVFGFLYEKSSLSWLAGQWGRLHSLDSPWSYADTRVCKKPKLVWFGDFNPLNAELNPICHFMALLGAHHIFHVGGLRVKVQFGSCILACRAACLANLSWYVDDPMWGIGEQERGCLFPLFRFVFCLSTCDESRCTFLFFKSSWCK